MAHTTSRKHIPSTAKQPLLTRVLDRLRDARDEYLEHLEAAQARAAAQRPPQKQSRSNHPQQHDNGTTEPHSADANLSTALTAQNLELHQKQDTDSDHTHKDKSRHKHRHHSHTKTTNAYRDPDSKAHHKHPNPDHHRKSSHRKHKPSQPQETTDTQNLVSRLVHRLEKGVEDESAQVEYLQDAAQRLLRIAGEKGKRAGHTQPPMDDNAVNTFGKPPRDRGPVDGLMGNGAGELVEWVKRMDERGARDGDQGNAEGFARRAVEVVRGLLEEAGEGRLRRGGGARRASIEGEEGHPGGRQASEEEGERMSPSRRDEERGRGGSFSSLASEERD